jgi:hypothetical protein
VVTSDAKTGVRTRIDFVEQHCKAKWPEFEKQLSEEQKRFLSEPIRAEEAIAWKVVEPQIRAQVRDSWLSHREGELQRLREGDCPAQLMSGPLNPENKHLGDEDLADLRVVASSLAVRIDAHAVLVFDLILETEEAIWDAGNYDASPFIELSTGVDEKHHADLIVLEKWKQGVWTVSYVLDSSEWERLRDALASLRSLREEWRHVVAEFNARR